MSLKTTYKGNMSFKTTYILFAVLVGMLGLLLLAQIRGKKPTDETAYVLPSLHEQKLDSKDINGLEIERLRPAPVKLVFLRDATGWRLKEPRVRADSSQINSLVSQIMRAAKEEKEADMSAGLATYGLDDPTEVVTLRMGAEKSWTINIGKASGGKEGALVYVTSSDRPNEPMAVKRFQLDGLIKDIDAKGDITFKSTNDYRAKVLLADSSFDISGVKFEEPKKEPVSLEKTSDGRWRFEKPAYGDADYDGEPASPGSTGTPQRITGVRDLLQAIADIRVDSEADFGPTDVRDTELADKGLEKGKEKLRIEAKIQPTLGGEDKKTPVTGVLLIGKKVDDKDEKYYARLEEEHNIVKVPAKKVEAVLKVLENPSALRNHDLVQIDSFKVDAIDLKIGGHELFKLRHVGEPAAWKIYESGKVQEADNSSVQALLTALTNKRQIKEFPEDKKTDAELGLDKPSAVLSVWVEGIKKEDKKDEKKDDTAKEEKKDEKTKDAKKDEKKDEKAKDAKKEEKKDPNAEPKLKEEKPTVRLSFGRKEKDLVYVRRETGTEAIRLAVPASLLDKVSEGKLAYLDHKLPSFGSTSDVTRVTLVRGSQTFEIEKAKDDKSSTSWKLKQPKELAERGADPSKVDRMVSDLHDLQAEKYVTEKATANELERFGLTTPIIKVTVTLAKPDKKTEDHVYLFGKDTDDKTGVYAKQGDRDLVFVARKSVVEALQGDLQDLVVFSFDLAKLKGLRLVGWQDIIGSPFTFDAERKDSQTWTVKAPPDYKLDVGKAEAFVNGLTHLRADRFLGPKTGPKPEYKLEVREGALEIYLTLDGEKEPAKLTIGGPSGNDGYYAMTSKLANEVFVLPKGSFGDVKGRPAYFKKE